MVMAHYGKVFMRQLDEKLQLLTSPRSHLASNIEKRNTIYRLRHLVLRLVDLRGWVLMRWGDEPCHALSHAHEEGQDEGLATH